MILLPQVQEDLLHTAEVYLEENAMAAILACLHLWGGEEEEESKGLGCFTFPVMSASTVLRSMNRCQEPLRNNIKWKGLCTGRGVIDLLAPF